MPPKSKLVTPLALAQEPVPIGKTGDVELRTETRVGSTSLMPGHYRFQHQLIDGNHYLVVHGRLTVRRTTDGVHWAGATGDEVARVACRFVSTDTKQRDTAVNTTKDADGTLRATQITIRGEKGSHLIIEPVS